MRIGTGIVIRKIAKDYHLREMLEQHMSSKGAGLLLDLASYSIIEEDNRAQYYPAYAYSHPLFTDGMKIYRDSHISEFLQRTGNEAGAEFLNDWNEQNNHRKKIYISYDSTSKKCQAGNLRIVEKGHSNENEETDIFNYAVAFDTKNREPLFYETYPRSINDMAQLRCTVDKALGYGYRKIGFILDRGYFSKDNIHHMEDSGYSFVMMLKGKASLVQEWVLENKGSFETKRACNISEYGVYGKTIQKKLFATDSKPRYIHIFHSSVKKTNERVEVEKKINQLSEFLKKHINKYIEFSLGMEDYFELHYDETAGKTAGEESEGEKKNKSGKFVFFEEKTTAIELELKLCGYFVIVTSDDMRAKEALELYKGRDASEKLFLSDKTFLGNNCLRVSSDESAAAKMFIGFVALIIRNRMYNYIREVMKEMVKKYKYMTVLTAIRELDKVEMARQLDGIYRLDYAITVKQKSILKAFGLDANDVRYRAQEISRTLEAGI